MASHCEKGALSQHDKAILNRVFNPDMPYADVVDDEEGAIPEPGRRQMKFAWPQAQIHLIMI